MIPHFSNIQAAKTTGDPVYKNLYEIRVHSTQNLLAHFTDEITKFGIENGILTLTVNLNADTMTKFMNDAKNINFINVFVHDKMGNCFHKSEYEVTLYAGYSYDLENDNLHDITNMKFQFLVNDITDYEEQLNLRDLQ